MKNQNQQPHSPTPQPGATAIAQATIQTDAGLKRFTFDQFRAAVANDPAWASKLTEPVEITDICELKGSPITHLSPLLHFTGRDENGICAYFENCKSLKVAEGTFSGSVMFSFCGIEKIGKLSIVQPQNDGNAAWFYRCASLKTAEGTYPGFVSFDLCGVTKIGNLNIIVPNKKGEAASFCGCGLLSVAEGKFPGFVDFACSGVVVVEDLYITQPDLKGRAASFHNCHNLDVAVGDFPGSVDYSGTTVIQF